MNPVAHGGDAETASSAVAFISVIMPVRNKALFIADTLRALVSQDYPPDRMEILVVDGQSDDGTQAIVREFASSYGKVKMLDNPKRWSSAARNIGVRNSTGQIITIVDGHCDIPGNQYLTNLAKAIERFVADPAFANRMGRNAREHVAARYSFEAMAERFAAFYAGLVPGETSAATKKANDYVTV